MMRNIVFWHGFIIGGMKLGLGFHLLGIEFYLFSYWFGFYLEASNAKRPCYSCGEEVVGPCDCNPPEASVE